MKLSSRTSSSCCYYNLRVSVSELLTVKRPKKQTNHLQHREERRIKGGISSSLFFIFGLSRWGTVVLGRSPLLSPMPMFKVSFHLAVCFSLPYFNSPDLMYVVVGCFGNCPFPNFDGFFPCLSLQNV